MKKSKAKTYIIILMASLILGIIGAALLFYAMNFDYIEEIQHFKPSPMVYGACAVAVCVLILAGAVRFFASKQTEFKKPEAFSFVQTFFSFLTGCFCAYYGYMSLSNGIIIGKEFLSIILVALSFLSALWFFADAFGLPAKFPSLKLLSYSPALMITFMSAQVYFNTETAMNGSIKSCSILMSTSLVIGYIEMCGTVFGFRECGRKTAAGFILSTGIGGAVSISLLATLIINSSGYNYTVLTAATNVALWLMSVIIFGSYVPYACIMPEPSDKNEETVSLKNEAEKSEPAESNDTEKTSEESDTAADVITNKTNDEVNNPIKKEAVSKTASKEDVFTMFDASKIDPEDRDEFYFEDDPEDDIVIPPMKFNDENE